MKIETEQEYEERKKLVGEYMDMLAANDSLRIRMEEELHKNVVLVEEYEKIHYPIDEPKYTEGQIRLAMRKVGVHWEPNKIDWSYFMETLDDIVINDESY